MTNIQSSLTGLKGRGTKTVFVVLDNIISLRIRDRRATLQSLIVHTVYLYVSL